MVEFETIKAKEVKFGRNNFIEISKKKAVTDRGEIEFIAISRGFYLPDGEKGWYISDVNIALTATDNDVSGIKETKYIINKGFEKTYESPITISFDGEYTVEYYSIDNATNKEQTRTIPPFKIDKTPPLTKCSKDGWFNTSIVEFKLITEDKTSGVNKTYYRIDNQGGWKTYKGEILEITGEENHIIEYYSIDEAGNREKNKKCSIGIDITKPLINIKKPKEKYQGSDYSLQSVSNRWIPPGIRGKNPFS